MKSIAKIIVVVLILIIIIYFLIEYNHTKKELAIVSKKYNELLQLNATKDTLIEKQSDIKSYDSEIENVKRNLNANLRVVTDGFSVKPLGGIYDGYLKITNNTDYQMESIEIRVSYLNEKGAEVDFAVGNFYKILPNSTRRIKIRDSKRGTQLKAAITRVYCAALDLN